MYPIFHLLICDCVFRAYSWGWGVHGQLGLGTVENSSNPSLINALDGQVMQLLSSLKFARTRSYVVVILSKILYAFFRQQVVNAIGGGHAHSLFLLSSGQVFGCGSSVFGQLGTGSNTKSSLPIPVCNLPESIIIIATGYFHNVRVKGIPEILMN